MKAPILTAIRFIAVTILYFGSFVVVSGALLSTAPRENAPADAEATLVALLIVSLLNAAVWTYVIRRSSWTGWKLVLTVFVVFYGANTLMPQIETAYLVTRLVDSAYLASEGRKWPNASAPGDEPLKT
ncbi:MAG: hypothetical protein V7638_5116 [Acidobacteriota bacterium]|jgi:hypothetical protein